MLMNNPDTCRSSITELRAGEQIATWNLRIDYFVLWPGDLEQVAEGSL